MSVQRSKFISQLNEQWPGWEIDPAQVRLRVECIFFSDHFNMTLKVNSV